MISQRAGRALRSLTATAALLAALAPAAVGAVDPVPTRVRVLKATRAGPAHYDPRLGDVKKQLSALAWQRWDVVSERIATLAQNVSTFVEVPDGNTAALSLVDVRGHIVTVEVAIAQRNTQSRITIEKGQRIVHQVAKEKAGVAYFLIVTPWP